MATMATYRIEQRIATIGETGTAFPKLLTVTSWNDRPAKLDLRVWRDEAGELKPTKGLTLTTAEARDLATALNEYLSQAS